MKIRIAPARPALQSPRLLDQLRERLRYLHYSLRTEQSYLYWVRWFIRFHGVRHPREMGKQEVEAFLTMLANERKVSASTHRQALSALLFLYKEVQRLLDLMEGETGLLARLLYGTGMRLMECLSLRVKDMDFSRHVIVVREGSDVSTTMIYTHVLKVAAGGTASPLDALNHAA